MKYWLTGIGILLIVALIIAALAYFVSDVFVILSIPTGLIFGWFVPGILNKMGLRR